MKGYILMKKMIVLAAMFLACAVITGCTSIHTSDGASVVPQIGADHPGYAATFTHKNVRVQGSAHVNVLFGIFAWGTEGFADNSQLSTFAFLPSPENFAKSAAVYDTCRKNKADLLVGTRYIVTTKDYFVFKCVKCEVAGFPAVMNGVAKKKPYVIGNEGKLVWLAEKPTVVK